MAAKKPTPAPTTKKRVRRQGPAKPMDNATALVHAIREGEVALVRKLLEDGVSVLGPSTGKNQPPIHVAANNAWPEIMELLVDNGANVDQRDGGRTPLHVIAGMDWWWYAKKSPERLERWLTCIRLLLARGADIEARDECDWTPLLLAAQRCSFALVGLLVERGANVNAKTNFGRNALHHLLEAPLARNTQPAEEAVACVELLLARGIDETCLDNNGATPRSLAQKFPKMPPRLFELLKA